ncbi:MAG: heme-binding domain-containing protein [Gemmatimonadetes bacterium]|nr:heme-binding domain-containing protein [Gemmatimonadota bacterium]MBT8405801.1 heme-binding domain-containing protein [Gemmatimonadota bacterium]NNF39250.1 heme-binding domain-containing protein [Gemmatimonadota bacterium]NNK64425.1 heme-binding domain-containing protein [Gemmatimonadota bacterium]
MSNSVKIALLALLAVFVALQLYPVDRANPPVTAALDLPEGEVGDILRDACLDCHSHETVWPWYSRIAPASFFVADHVEEGREHLNFSTWTTEDVESRDHMLEEMVEVMEEREMPLRSYTLIHPEARLTGAQRSLLIRWARERRAGLRSSESREPYDAAEDGEHDRREGRG